MDLEVLIQSGQEIIKPDYCSIESLDAQEQKGGILRKLEELGLKYEDINKDNIEKIIQKVILITGLKEDDTEIENLKKRCLLPNEEWNLIRQNETKSESKGNDNFLCLPSAGIAVKNLGGIWKYQATSSTSFSIPIVSGLFVMARQVKDDISLEDFSKLCLNTAKKENGYMVIQPKEIMYELTRKIKETQDLEKINLSDIRKSIDEHPISLEHLKETQVKMVSQIKEKTKEKNEKEQNKTIIEQTDDIER